MGHVHFIVPGDPAQRTGGYLFDAQMVQAMQRAKIPVEVVGLAGAFPIADELARTELIHALCQTKPEDVVILDGLALGGLGEVFLDTLAKLGSSKPRCLGLIHHPLADERGLSETEQDRLFQQERLALSGLDAVVVTSPFTARRLQARGYVTEPPIVITPGATLAPLAKSVCQDKAHSSMRSQALLCVASLTPRKGHAVLLAALDQIRDLDWVCEWVGGARDRVHAAHLEAEIDRLGLSERIVRLGELDDEALAAAYHRADVGVLASWYEGYGMVVTETLARGLPMITTDGGALADTLPPGAGVTVPIGDVDALAQALSDWCQDEDHRGRLRAGALAAREDLNSWEEAGQRFIDALGLSTLGQDVGQ